ncbi:RNA polymerase sigma factor [Algihabitans albus]|uniref:RNA polymerase sigma factor n=1 Tax=Algihabitans albus TaxID=2164067 RepID=UPI0035D007D7
MPESNRIALRQLLLSRFDELRSRLSRRFGSSERADEALQETYLRLEQGSEIGPVRNPSAYLLRMAINTATNLLVAQNQRLTVAETEALLQIPDDTPGPMRVVESRLEVEALKRALEDLPERRRAIFLASWVEELPHREIAERYGVSVRTVQVELKRALEHCAARLGKRLERK